VNTKTNSHAWITSGIRTSCKQERDLFLLCRNSNDAKLEIHYKTYCKILSKVIKEAKKYHFSRLIENSDNKMKTIWDNAKLLTAKKKNTKDIHQINVDGTVTLNGQIIANSCNNYFISIIGNCTPVARSKNPIDYIKCLRNHFQLLSIKIHLLLKLKKSLNFHGYDEISVKILKLSSLFISSPLNYICTKLLSSGIFPCRLKYAEVVLLFKKGGKKERIIADLYLY
jgi:hypothetical protein